MIESPAIAVIGPFPWSEIRIPVQEILHTRNSDWIYLPLTWDGKRMSGVPYNPGHTFCTGVEIRRVGAADLWEVTLGLRQLRYFEFFGGEPDPEMERPVSWNILWASLGSETAGEILPSKF